MSVPAYSVRVLPDRPQVALVALTADEIELLATMAAQRVWAYANHRAGGLFPDEQQLMNRWLILSEKLERAKL